MKFHAAALTGILVVAINSDASRTNRIYRRSPMQTEKYQPESKRKMPETRLAEIKY